MENNKTTVLLALALGVVVGVNWPKIQKYLKPYLEGTGESCVKGFYKIVALLMSTKEHMEDITAEAEIETEGANSAVEEAGTADDAAVENA